MSHRRLRVTFVDMNNGVANQATRCFRRIVEAFRQTVHAANSGLDVQFRHVQPRNLGELPDDDTDIVLGSGGPGSPYDGFDDPWGRGFRRFLDHVHARNLAQGDGAPKALLVCHSFQLAVMHFGVAEMRQRATTRFGLFPAYTTRVGQDTDFLRPFGDRLFTWEHRNWEAVNLDHARMKELGAQVLACESRPGKNDKGQAVLAMKFCPGIWGTQFHPEADKPGIMAWIDKTEHREKVRGAYGDLLLERMVKSMAHPERLAKTFSLLIPSWLTYRFNELARAALDADSAAGARSLRVRRRGLSAGPSVRRCAGGCSA
jgi:GMP synthase-like glutamine amidotransferase